MEPVLTVDEARSRVLSAFSVCNDTIAMPLIESSGRVLAEDFVAQEDVPPFRNSAMDGYAIRSIDCAGASADRTVTLPVVDEVVAGDDGLATVPPRCAIRIMTGAPVPTDADAVIRFEDVQEHYSGAGSHARLSIIISSPASASQNIRAAGEDVPAGSIALARGTVVGAAEIGMLAALDCQTVSCRRPPRVAILATGDEIVGAEEPRSAGQIRDSNSPMLAALTRQFGAEPRLLGIAHDVERDIIDHLADSGGADLIVTSGGVSVGDYDVVKQVLRREGDIDLWRVRMKPGKPLAFGRVGGTPLLGLPGNPAAAYVAYIQFGRPAIRRMLGLSESADLVPARLIGDVENHGGRRHFVRATITRAGHELVVSPIQARGSSSLSTLAAANCLIVIPEGEDRVLHGAVVNVQITGEVFGL